MRAAPDPQTPAPRQVVHRVLCPGPGWPGAGPRAAWGCTRGLGKAASCPPDRECPPSSASSPHPRGPHAGERGPLGRGWHGLADPGGDSGRSRAWPWEVPTQTTGMETKGCPPERLTPRGPRADIPEDSRISQETQHPAWPGPHGEGSRRLGCPPACLLRSGHALRPPRHVGHLSARLPSTPGPPRHPPPAPS